MPVEYDPKAAKDLKGVPPDDRKRLEDRLAEIAGSPHRQYPGVRPLKGADGVFRVRQGDWRAVYTVTPRGDVRVLRVRHRREVYR